MANNSSLPCPPLGTVITTPDGHSVTVTGTYVRSTSTHAETFYIDSFTDNGVAATVPATASVTLATVQRSSTAYDKAFQRVSASINGSLVMYDWTPTEFVFGGAATCPYQFGFAMAPASAGLTATGACVNATSQPAGQTSPSPLEVLIGADFYNGFTVTSDCRCASAPASTPSAASTLTGTISGLLVWEVLFPSTGFMYIAPTKGTDAPITSTVAGM